MLPPVTPDWETVQVYEVPPNELLKETAGPAGPQISGVASDGVPTGLGFAVTVTLIGLPVQVAVAGVIV